LISLEALTEQLANHILSWDMPEPARLDVRLVPQNLLPIINDLYQLRWGYLAAITGLDHGPETSEMEVLYHFCAAADVLTLRVHIPRENAALPSICSILPYAGVFERELSEMFGVIMYGAPDDSRLFLPDDWPEGVYPLRKDAKEPEDD